VSDLLIDPLVRASQSVLNRISAAPSPIFSEPHLPFSPPKSWLLRTPLQHRVYTPVAHLLRFTRLSLSLLRAITPLAATYLWLVQAVKSWFYRRHALL
jgi:hypothetical protein